MRSEAKVHMVTDSLETNRDKEWHRRDARHIAHACIDIEYSNNNIYLEILYGETASYLLVDFVIRLRRREI